MLDDYHQRHVYDRRVARLVDAIAPRLPANARVLDVGCGDGLVSSLVSKVRDDVTIQGIDVLVRPETHIPVSAFDGERVPFDDGHFDAIMCIDVLHHTRDPMVLLREFGRVARTVVIKDHLLNGILAGPTLRFMDFVGNARHGVNLPYNYWPRRQWQRAFDELAWVTVDWNERLALYPPWLDWWFGRSLHFVARFDVPAHAEKR